MSTAPAPEVPPPRVVPAAADGARKLGTFLGVYTPTVLTILGVIMFLRLGWATGRMGLAGMLAIIVVANVITFITTLSFSSIATNIDVGVGGAYYIISRSLGLELGGAIGLPLFLSQALSVTLYAFGLAESVRLVFPAAPVQESAAVIVLLVGLLAVKGAGMALKAQIPLMLLIAVSIGALVWGALTKPVTNLSDAWAAPGLDPDFWVVFAVFFPAVTGVMAGLGLSGDLRDPSRSIPRGSISATLTGSVVYMVVPVLLVLGATQERLVEDTMVWAFIAPGTAVVGLALILPGLWGAILSSAIGSVLGAPRTLQALANDGLAPRILGRVEKSIPEPLVGLAVTLALAVGAILLGDLNAVAQVVSMFFLTVYGMVNLAAALEAVSGDPSWRPRLRARWWLSVVGFAGCVGAMFLINPLAGLIAVTVELVLWLVIARRQRRRTTDFGDARRGGYEALIRWSLVRLSARPMTARSWRPHVLLFIDDVDRRIDLVRFGVWFSQGRGVVTVCRLVEGEMEAEASERAAQQRHIAATLNERGLVAFAEVDVVPQLVDGIVGIAQANGIAGLDSNTIVLGWPKDPRRLAEFLRATRVLETINKSVVIGRLTAPAIRKRRAKKRIDVWWRGRAANGDLMLLLAYLLTRNREWRRTTVRLLTVLGDDRLYDFAKSTLEALSHEVRIHAEVQVFTRADGEPTEDVIVRESADADVVFLGLISSAPGDELKHAKRIRALTERLPTTFLVKNSSLFPGELV